MSLLESVPLFCFRLNSFSGFSDILSSNFSGFANWRKNCNFVFLFSAIKTSNRPRKNGSIFRFCLKASLQKRSIKEQLGSEKMFHLIIGFDFFALLTLHVSSFFLRILSCYAIFSGLVLSVYLSLSFFFFT